MSSSPSSETLKKWRNLFHRLDYGTSIGRVTWQETASEGNFLAKVGDGVIIFGHEIRSGREFYFVRIETSDGKVVDAFDDEDLDSDVAGEYFSLMKDLNLKITRQHSGADKYLDEIISSLPEPDPS